MLTFFNFTLRGAFRIVPYFARDTHEVLLNHRPKLRGVHLILSFLFPVFILSAMIPRSLVSFVSAHSPRPFYVAISVPEARSAIPSKARRILPVVATAYSSTRDQTDDTPFITANGTRVYDGLIAANFLPFGTKVKMPELFGDKVFTVNDRMNARYRRGRVDIWMTTREKAISFGAKRVRMEIQ
jgi:3D (Asp-Asp-Asp) domain-containing protein